MDDSLNALLDYYADRLVDRHERSAPRIGAMFDSAVCRVESKLTDAGNLLMQRFKDGSSTALPLLKAEKFFAREPFDAAILRAVFWAFQMTVLDHWDSVTYVGANEETQNSALMAHLCSSLKFLSMLDKRVHDHGQFVLYGADCRSDGTESRLGCDLALVVPIEPDCYKVALFQAKKAVMDGLTSIARESPKKSGRQQLTRLLAAERPFTTARADAKALFGKLCFYLFWHDPRTLLLPTILSAAQANQQLKETTGVDYAETGENDRSAPSGGKGMLVQPLAGGTWFSEAIPLLLADPAADFGVKMQSEQVVALLASKETKPRQIVGIQIPGRNLGLGDWRDLIDPDLVAHERFFREGTLYEGRDAFDATYPPAATLGR